MRLSLLLLGSLLVLFCTGCASSPETKRPTAYRGGQYYGDALHAEDLARNEDRSLQSVKN